MNGESGDGTGRTSAGPNVLFLSDYTARGLELSHEGRTYEKQRWTDDTYFHAGIRLSQEEWSHPFRCGEYYISGEVLAHGVRERIGIGPRNKGLKMSEGSEDAKRKLRLVFACSTSAFGSDAVPQPWLDHTLGVIERSDWLRPLVLTKRPGNLWRAR